MPNVSCCGNTTSHPAGDKTGGQEINDTVKGDEEPEDQTFGAPFTNTPCTGIGDTAVLLFRLESCKQDILVDFFFFPIR